MPAMSSRNRPLLHSIAIGKSALSKLKKILENSQETTWYSSSTVLQEFWELTCLLQWDPNLDQRLYRRTKSLAAGQGDLIEKMGVDQELMENSPYPEVRAAVPPTDDPEIPCVTSPMSLPSANWCRTLSVCGSWHSYSLPSDLELTCFSP